ncbi:DNA adenine methylase [Campylobacter jejuni]|nr:DNA adenine methylase [Campylobacter jejuni]
MSSLFSNLITPIIYKKAPLPFQGQKKYFLNKFNECLDEFLNDYKGDLKDLIFVDAFGGSGLLSHTIKTKIPQAKVIWNDFDDYQRRLDEIPFTNELLKHFEMLRKYKKGEKISNENKEFLLSKIKEQEKLRDFVDYITLSPIVAHSAGVLKYYEEFEKTSWFFKGALLKKDASGYLEGVQRVSVDFTELLNEYKENTNAIFVLDPPYLQTNVDGYKDNFYTLKDFLELARLIRAPYLFFSSERSSFLEFAQWDFTKNNNLNFKDFKIKEAHHSKSSVGQKNTKDYLIYKF